MWKLSENAPDEASDENFTFLSKGASFQGSVKFDGTVRIDGTLDGEIVASGALVVGEQGLIKGIVSVGTMTVSGKVYASVIASEKIEIRRTGVVMGEIQSPRLSIEDGGLYQGQCDMGVPSNIEERSNVLSSSTIKNQKAKSLGIIQALPVRSDS